MKTIKGERQANKIWSFMRDKGFTGRDIMRACGHKSSCLASNTIAGRSHNRKVLRFLVTKGCPKKYLGLPQDMRGKS